MKQVEKKALQSALRKAKQDYINGLRYYDEKHNTYNPASFSENILQHVSDLVGLFGVEAYDPDDSNPSHPRYSYVNSGDVYNLTLIFDSDRRCFVFSDIGSIIERHGL